MKTSLLSKVIAITFGLVIVYAVPVQAQQPTILKVSTNEGRGLNGQAINVKVWAGRATAIDFSGVNERITQIFLADPSRFTYASDTPLESGQATTIFLRQIQPLKFPQLTTATVTNLFVKTITAKGTTRLYTFNVQPGENLPKYSGLIIVEESGVELKKRTLEVGSFRPATLQDIERGLVSALHRGYTPTSDSIVTKVRKFLVLARNTNDKSWLEIAQYVNLPLPVLTALGLLGIEDVSKLPSTIPIRIIPTPKIYRTVNLDSKT